MLPDVAQREVRRRVNQQVVGDEVVEGGVTDHRAYRREVVLEAVADAVEIHVRVDVEPFDGRQPRIATHEFLGNRALGRAERCQAGVRLPQAR